jgi:hypothetical protein
MLPEDRHHPIRLESLTDQVSEEPAEFGLVGEALASPQPPPECRVEQGVVIDRVEYRVDRVTGGVGRDAGLFDLPPHTQLAVAAHGRLGMGNRLGDPDVVDGPLGTEPFDGRVDRVLLVPLAREPLPNLRFGQFAAAEHLEAVHVRGRLWLRDLAPGPSAS